MWEVWKGPRKSGTVINHIDGDRSNNSIDNLEEITQKENIENLIKRGKFKLFGKKYVRVQEGMDGQTDTSIRIRNYEDEVAEPMGNSLEDSPQKAHILPCILVGNIPSQLHTENYGD